MIITLIIVGGIVIISVIAVIGDSMTKMRKTSGSINPKAFAGLRERVEVLETQARDDEARMARLEGEIAFTTKLLEGKGETER